jgi:hypothetical protein
MRRLLIALAFIPLPAGAWTHASDQRIAQVSARLAPPDLRLVIHRYEKDFARGLQLALADKGPIHGTNLRQSIERETRTIVMMIRGNQPMNVVVEHLGILAHLVGDANNPMYVPSAVDLQPSRGDFENYLERALPRIPTVFYGVEGRFQLTNFLDRLFNRTAHFTPLMAEEYFRFGTRRTATDFDDRSTAFGVASLCYSHAVSDAVNLYYYIWREAGGDVRAASALRARGVVADAY